MLQHLFSSNFIHCLDATNHVLNLCRGALHFPEIRGFEGPELFSTKERQFFSWGNFRRSLYFTVNPFGSHFRRWLRYIDDIFFIFSGSVQELEVFSTIGVRHSSENQDSKESICRVMMRRSIKQKHLETHSLKSTVTFYKPSSTRYKEKSTVQPTVRDRRICRSESSLKK